MLQKGRTGEALLPRFPPEGSDEPVQEAGALIKALHSTTLPAMPIEATLNHIVARLRQNKFPNEQAISQGVVLRVLQELGWDTWDTGLVWPEYQTGEGRSDFALCHPSSKPAIFIEVKQPG
jgi:hypothetical protein